MASKKDKLSAPRECMFLGNSKELKAYLITKKKVLTKALNSENFDHNKKSTLEAYIDMIEFMLELNFFYSRKIYTMPELIDAIKVERSELDEEMDNMKPVMDKARQMVDLAFENADRYMANKYEELYESEKQKVLRDSKTEYEIIEWEYEILEKRKRVLWWLLGVIHRPLGFFENVI